MQAIIDASAKALPAEEQKSAEKERLGARLDFLLLRGSMADLNAANDILKQLAFYDAPSGSMEEDPLPSPASKSGNSGGQSCSAEFVEEIESKMDVLESLPRTSAILSNESLRKFYDACKASVKALATNSTPESRDLLVRIRGLVGQVEGAEAIPTESIRIPYGSLMP